MDFKPKLPLLAATLAAGIGVGGGAMYLLVRGAGAPAGEQTAAKAKAGVQYQCPMHPTVVKDAPGTCPICGMNLVPMAAHDHAGATPAAAQAAHVIKFYRSPMNPQQTSPVPRKDEMGMDYVPVYADELADSGPAPVPGMATVAIDPARQQLIGLRTTEVTAGPVGGGWRTVAKIQVAPPQVRKVNVKIAGYVERVFVDFVGRSVRRGDPLFTLYSPDLLSAQNEYLLALRTRAQLQAGGLLAGNGAALVDSARRKLELWDVPRSEIDRLERSGKPLKALAFTSPINGVVTAKNIVEGASVQPGDIPYEITDLSELWVMADAYEADLSRVKVGMPATLTVRAYPDHKFKGTVSFIDPLLDPNTRTLKVHLHFHNPKGELKPEMYGEVALQGKEQQGLRVPFDAVIHTGSHDVVFVAVGEGKFQPREVKLGIKAGDYYEVKSGLAPGDQVVTRANFLIDSESRLKASLSALGDQ
jgi:Cu(I)/Ag(I) efflux system membrane fusion protein